MQYRRPAQSTYHRVLLSCSAAFSVLASHAVMAQPVAVPLMNRLPIMASSAPRAATPAPEDDGLGETGFYLEADTVIRDDNAKVITARGDVEARYQGRTIRAQELVYSVKTGIVTARGKAQIIGEDGSTQSADEITLDNKLQSGVAYGFSTVMAPNIKFAAATAVRRSETINELNRAIYTPCDICSKSGESKTPSWSISADRIVQDRQRQLVYYRNAVVKVLGVPVFYAPIFWHPDPQAERSSGLLPPRIQNSRRRGFSYEQPYLLVISPSQDLIISPQINESVNPFLNLEWRKRFYSGEVEARLGYTHDRDIETINGDLQKIGDDTSRSYILAKGRFNINKKWDLGFGLERASDPLIFDKYNIGRVYQDNRGLFNTDSRRLLSQVFATRQDERSYLSMSLLSFQGLRTTDNNHAIPVAAPLIEARYEPTDPVMGGRLRLRGSGVALFRDQSYISASEPGIDSRRATGEADWRRIQTFANGVRLEPFVSARGDYYNIADQSASDRKSQSIGRSTGTIGVDVSYPLIRKAGATTIILEPIAQLALSPEAKANSRIPNEDSISFEFDETNLFDTNRYPGFDLYEGGQRLNVGLRTTVDWGSGRNARVLIGRSYRAQADTVFPLRTGLRDTSSDWVTSASITPVAGLSMFARTRLDSDTLEVRRQEAGANLALSKVRGYVRYLSDKTDVTGVKVQDVQGAGEVYLTKTWGLTFAGVRDLENKVWRTRELGLLYKDECTRVEIVYQREETYNRTLGPSDNVLVRLTLATLGDAGYRDYDDR
jgi:LPS-assembly protein